MALTNGMSKMEAAGQLIIKASYGEDIRRIPIHNDDLTYDELVLMMQRVYRGVIPADQELVLKYKDEDGDLVSLADTNDLSYAIQYSRVLRLTILQQGEALVKTNSLDMGIIRELRTIRDKVNKVLDMVTVETSKDSTGDQKTEEVEEETVTEAVSQLQLEQSKEFDPLEQSQVQPETPEKSRQQSGQSSVSSGQQFSANTSFSGGQQPASGYQPQPGSAPSFPPSGPQTTPAPAFPPTGPPASGYPPAGPPSGYPQAGAGANLNYPTTGPPTSSYAPPTSAPGYSQPPSGPPVSAGSFSAASNPPTSAPSFPPAGPTTGAPTYPPSGPPSSTSTFPPSGPPTSAPTYQPSGPPSSAPSFPPSTQSSTSAAGFPPTGPPTLQQGGYPGQGYPGYPQSSYPSYQPQPGYGASNPYSRGGVRPSQPPQ